MSTEKRNGKTKGSARLAPVSGYAPVLVMPLNTAPETVAEARGCGYLPVLADDPNKVVLILPGREGRMSGDVMLSAMTALASDRFHLSDAQCAFVREFQRRLLKHEGA